MCKIRLQGDHALRNRVVRIWRQEDVEPWPSRDDLVELVQLNAQMESLALARRVLAAPRVNAVEVLDADGNGCVTYRDWP